MRKVITSCLVNYQGARKELELGEEEELGIKEAGVGELGNREISHLHQQQLLILGGSSYNE